MATTIRVLFLGSLLLLFAESGAAQPGGQRKAKADLSGHRPFVVKSYPWGGTDGYFTKGTPVADFDSYDEAQAYATELWHQEPGFPKRHSYEVERRPQAGPQEPYAAASDEYNRLLDRFRQQAAAIDMTRKRISEDAKASKPGSSAPPESRVVPEFDKIARQKALVKWFELTKQLDTKVVRENDKNAVARSQMGLLKDVKENPRKADLDAASGKKAKTWEQEHGERLRKMDPEQRKSVLDELDKAVLGFKESVEKGGKVVNPYESKACETGTTTGPERSSRTSGTKTRERGSSTRKLPSRRTLS